MKQIRRKGRSSQPRMEEEGKKEAQKENGLVSKDVVIRIGRFPVQTPPGTRLGLGTQPRYEASGDHWAKVVKTQ